jgi:hypothetical protein
MNHNKPHTFNQISEQLDDGKRATVLVERTDGTISTGQYDGHSADIPGLYKVTVDANGSYKNLGGDTLTDEHQALLAERLAQSRIPARMGGAAVEAARGVVPAAGVDSEGLIVVPDWVKQSPAPEVKPAQKSPKELLAEQKALITSKMDELVKDLSPEDVKRLDRYSRYMHAKRQAQNSGDGEGSTRNGQYAGQEERAMSPGAKKVLSQYQHLWDQL